MKKFPTGSKVRIWGTFETGTVMSFLSCCRRHGFYKIRFNDGPTKDDGFIQYVNSVLLERWHGINSI